MNQLQQYIHLSRYARYLDGEKRRETWNETVTRYCKYFQEKFDIFPYDQIYNAIHKLEVMPSMRALMTAGPALDRDNIAGYNCSYIAVDHPRAFDEIMYILLCGTGVGFSVERTYINALPEVPEQLHETDTTIVVSDSKIGWASGLRELISLLYAGKIPKFSFDKVRPAGARLKVFGGRASGPGPLENLFKSVVQIFVASVGRRLHSIEVHDIVCKIADSVVVGGVRRSALISLSNLTDERLRNAKTGQWWESNGHRALANNSVAYTEKPDMGVFIREWESLYGSKSGERGIFNRNSAATQVKANGRRLPDFDFGTNPCGEIILRPAGLCNLSEVVVRSTDGFEDLRRKVEIATIIGTFQSTLTNFRYLRPIWKRNAEEERLLGVSLTGIMDHGVLSGHNDELHLFLKELKEHAITINKEWAERLGIAQSVSITTVKPSGTVSQLVDSASGIHPRYSEFYIRTVRADKKDPLAIFMREKGFPVEDDVTKPNYTDVFSFPVRGPRTSVLRSQMSALQQLEHYLVFKRHWCEHNPSITIYVREHEWLEVGAWVYRNFDEIGGVSFLPYDTGIYRQAPYKEITEDEYNKACEKMPAEVDWQALKEETDETTGSQELACSSGVCEL
ncbi:MAG: glycyl radical enzyme family protein [Nitrosotalea sp.]